MPNFVSLTLPSLQLLWKTHMFGLSSEYDFVFDTLERKHLLILSRPDRNLKWTLTFENAFCHRILCSFYRVFAQKIVFFLFLCKKEKKKKKIVHRYCKQIVPLESSGVTISFCRGVRPNQCREAKHASNWMNIRSRRTDAVKELISCLLRHVNIYSVFWFLVEELHLFFFYTCC